MCRWWLRAGRATSRAALGATLILAGNSFIGCGGSSKSKSGASSGGAGNAGASGAAAGNATRGGAGGTSAGAAAAAASGAVSGTGDASGGVGGATSGGVGGATSGGAGAATSGGEGGAGDAGMAVSGTSGAMSAAGGAAGEGGSSAGESSGGAGGGCPSWCTPQAPACCVEELRCVERAPACRIDVLSKRVDTIYEYADLKAEISALSGVVAAAIPLAAVERAAADPPPAARFELTFGAEASAELTKLEGMDLHPFRVSCDEHELFVGVIYMLGGAAALRTPVLHVEVPDDGPPVLRLGAWQGAWLFGEAGEEELCERIDRVELRAGFCSRGVLEELE